MIIDNFLFCYLFNYLYSFNNAYAIMLTNPVFIGIFFSVLELFDKQRFDIP